VVAELGVAARPARDLPEGLVLEEPFDVHGSALWARGAVMAQSRGSMLVGRAVDVAPGQRVLDLCAAPGAKTTQLAALMGDTGELTAVEQHPGRAQALQRTLARMHVGRAGVVVGDAGVVVGDAAAPPSAQRGYDRVLVDPPCSGLGTLQSRPDLRWRTSPERIGELAVLQARILRAGAAVTRSGGALVYSVCTISRSEGADVVESFLAEHPEFSADPLGDRSDHPDGEPWRRLLPHRDGTDGFFIARLRRA
jgi:16S rRNA (cytosine967-C5)-methyltransferase